MKKRATLYGSQFRTVGQTLESWKQDHDEAMEVRDVEGIIRFCLCLHEWTKGMVAEAWEAGFTGRLIDSQGDGGSLLRLLDDGVQAWEAIAREVQSWHDRGYSVENEERLPDALAEMRRLRQDFAARWPRFTPEELQRGRDQISRGEFVTEGELLRAFQDKNRQAG